MVCYVVPTVAAIVVYFLKTTVANWRGNTYYNWFFMFLMGGAIFGLIDHLWNGELFLVGSDVLTDIALGITITVGISFAWAILVTLDKSKKDNTLKTTQ